MGYLRFDTEAEARDYDNILLMEIAEVKGLPVKDGKVLGIKDGQVTEDHPTTSWSNVREVEGLGWIVSPPDWRELTEYEIGMVVELPLQNFDGLSEEELERTVEPLD
jgi:hypothetical protein